MPKPRSIRDARYNAKSSKHYGFKLNVKTDADLIDRLANVDSINGYIRRLIREDIARADSDKTLGGNATESFGLEGSAHG